jgi:hypothetical protein
VILRGDRNGGHDAVLDLTEAFAVADVNGTDVGGAVHMQGAVVPELLPVAEQESDDSVEQDARVGISELDAQGN